MMPINTLLITCLVAVANVGNIYAFSHTTQIRSSKISHIPQTTTSSLLASISPQQDERSDNNPSTKFGSPLSEGLKDANRFRYAEIVHILCFVHKIFFLIYLYSSQYRVLKEYSL